MPVKTFDVEGYSELLRDAHPRVPQNETENERLLAIVEELNDRTRLTAEHKALLELLLVVIQTYEDRRYSTKPAAPNQVLIELMRARGLAPKDLYRVFGSKGTTSEVLRGKRAISKAAAKMLGEIFHVDVGRFL